MVKELWGGEPPHLLCMNLISHGIQSNPSYALWSQIEAPFCGEQRKPCVTEVLSDCVLLTWAWPCQESHSFKLRDGQAVLQGPNVSTVSTEDVHHSFLLPDVCSPEIVSLGRLLLLRLVEPLFLIQLFSISSVSLFLSLITLCSFFSCT